MNHPKKRLSVRTRFVVGLVLTAAIFAGGIVLKLWLRDQYFPNPDWWSVLIGLAASILAGFVLVGPLLDHIEQGINKNGVYSPFTKSDSLNVKKWETLIGRGGGGWWLGFLERILFFAAFYIGKWEIAGGWLAFKLASKWESWKIVGDLSKESLGENSSGMDLILARRQWATLGYQSFLIGTLLNGLIAYCALLIATLV